MPTPPKTDNSSQNVAAATKIQRLIRTQQASKKKKELLAMLESMQDTEKKALLEQQINQLNALINRKGAPEQPKPSTSSGPSSERRSS